MQLVGYDIVDDMMDYVMLHKKIFPDAPIRMALWQYLELFRRVVPDYPEVAANIEDKVLWGVRVQIVS